MTKSMIATLSLFLGMAIAFSVTDTSSPKLTDPKVYQPTQYRPRHQNSLGCSGGYRSRKNPLAREKSRLKQLGTTVAIYFSDETPATYPKGPLEFDIDTSLFFPRHLKGKYIRLANSWHVPDNWQAFNHSNAPYVFLLKEGEEYTGSADVPLFIVRDGYQAYPGLYSVVYEDGHVMSVKRDEAIELWKKAGVWNEE
ncbi:MAG: hypothetical protein NE334_01710 [Lentisphaeraceae bacterium]|nr:hypothetical protein [Lentisphaeraceae bacterium]